MGLEKDRKPDTRLAGPSWIDPKYDAAGNMTTAPRPGDEADATKALITVYDAWGRPAKVHETPDGDANLDGKVDGSDLNIYLTNTGNSGDWEDGDFDGDGTVDSDDQDILNANWNYDVATGTDTLIATYSYDGKHRRIRKVVEGSPDVTYDYYYNTGWQVLEVQKDSDTDPLKQYVWDIRYIDTPVLRWRDSNTDGQNIETVYYANDANMNVTALVGTDGAVVERYMYDAYGKVTVLDADWSADADGKSDFDNEILYCGYRYDPETGLYHVRYRYYHTSLGRWVSRDPIEDGMNLYEYVEGCPTNFLDPLGLGLVEHLKSFARGVGRGAVNIVTGAVKAAWYTGTGAYDTIVMSGGAAMWGVTSDPAYMTNAPTVGYASRKLDAMDRSLKEFGKAIKKEQETSGTGCAIIYVAETALKNIPISGPLGDNIADIGEHGWRPENTERFGGSAVDIVTLVVSARLGGMRWTKVQASRVALRTKVLSNLKQFHKGTATSNFPIHTARTYQIFAGYRPDIWKMTTLAKGKTVYTGVPQSSFFTDFQAVYKSRFGKEQLWRSLQVKPNPVRGYRPEISAYKVKSNIRVPTGKVLANPELGSGGATQFYIGKTNVSKFLEEIRKYGLLDKK